MNMRSKFLAGAVCIGLGWAAVAYASGLYTNGAPLAGSSQWPTTLPLTGNEQVPADTELASGQNPQSEAINMNQIAAFTNGLPAKGNVLIGGDASTNLWQRGTTGASETTTVTFGGPDRWAYWSGTNTAMTVSQATTAAALPAGYQDTFRMQRTASQTGVVQMCMAQEVESVNSTQFQGSTAELDFHAYTGANYSAAAPYNMTAYIIYGTGTDDGMQKLAYGLNAGGGGSTGWTGQTNATAAVISLGGVSTAGRYAAVANIPATATEIGVALCYTPVGTAGTTDAIYFAGIQLVRNPAVASFASATVGYNDTTFPAQSFERRTQALESLYQYRYYYQITESSTAIRAEALCAMSTTLTANCFVPLPTIMRVAPTMSYATGFEVNSTTASTSAAACSALATSTTLTGNAVGPLGVIMACTTTTGAAGTAGFLWDVGTGSPTGAIKANAEMT